MTWILFGWIVIPNVSVELPSSVLLHPHHHVLAGNFSWRATGCHLALLDRDFDGVSTGTIAVIAVLPNFITDEFEVGQPRIDCGEAVEVWTSYREPSAAIRRCQTILNLSASPSPTAIPA